MRPGDHERREIIGLLVIIAFSSLFHVLPRQGYADGRVHVGIYPGSQEIWEYEAELGVELNHILRFQRVNNLNYTDVALYLDLGYDVILNIEFQDTFANLDAVAAGFYDAYLLELAAQLTSDGRTIWLRPLHEFNGDWYNWGVFYDGNAIEDFIPAWRHVVQLFRSQNAPVRFQLNYNRYNGLEDPTPFSAFWPGEEWVDMVVITCFNRAYTDQWHQFWHTFTEDFEDAYRQLTALTDHPLGVAEVSSTSYGGNKSQWILDTFTSIKYEYPHVEQVTWLLRNKQVEGILWDWDLNTQEEKDAFTEGMTLLDEPQAVLSCTGCTGWHWIDDTVITSVATSDVDGDGTVEVVTGGSYFDGEREVAQLVVWKASNWEVEGVTCWYWTGDTRINAIASGNLDGDDDVEIITGGFFSDGTRKVAQLVVWDGATLAVDGLTTWYWTDNTEINAVKIADVDGDGVAEIITGGYYQDGVREVAQLVVWNGTTFTVENLAVWYWTGDTRINAIDVANVDGDAQLEIVTGGYYTDAQRIAQLVVWDGVTLAPENVTAWYWTSDTEVTAVVAANADADGEIEIVTGGYYNDASRDVAQLVVWSHDLQTVERVVGWHWTGDTRIESIGVADVDAGGVPEIVTGGFYNDLTREVAQLVVWDGATLAVDYLMGWYWTGDTGIYSVAVGNVDGDVPPEIVTGGSFHDGMRQCAQTTLWEIS
jgi:hypothetical protein